MIEYNKDLTHYAKKLRKEMTKQENHLWYDFLKNYPLKIYKQKVINNYIADFYCHMAKLVIEIDGSQHYTKESLEYDNERTKVFNSMGIAVIRFTNQEIDKNFSGICTFIDAQIHSKMSL